MGDIVVSADLPRGLHMPAQTSTNKGVSIACIYRKRQNQEKKAQKSTYCY